MKNLKKNLKKKTRKTQKLKFRKTYPNNFEETLETIVKQLCPYFTFGYYDSDDIAQEARLYGYEAMEKYDESRPLGGFLFTSIKRKLINLKRNKNSRTDAPCKKCHGGEYCGGEGEYCDVYYEWKKRNAAKSNIMKPLGLDEIIDINEPHCSSSGDKIFDELVAKELLDRINTKLQPSMRSTFQKVLSGQKIGEAARRDLISEVSKILKEEKDDGTEEV